MTQPTLFDPTPYSAPAPRRPIVEEPGPRQSAEAARDAALEQVTQPSFSAQAQVAILALPAGEYTGESIRVILEAAGIVPHHHNAWGAAIMKARQGGILEHVGYEKMRTEKSHGRETKLYRKA